MSRHSRSRSRAGNWSLLLVLFGLLLVCEVFVLGTPVAQSKMPDRVRHDVFLIATGLLGIAGGVVWSREQAEASSESRIVTLTAVAIPLWALLQIIPLPYVLLRLLSPARAELLRGLEPVLGRPAFASLSIVPAVTFIHFLLLSGYCVLFLGARELAMRARQRIWMVLAPVMVAAAGEAVLGVLQFTAPGNVVVQGTYVVRNHLAGLLEMSLPLAVMYGVASLQAARNGGRTAKTDALKAVGGVVVALLLLTAAFATSSRGGLMSLLGSGLIVSVMAVGRMPLKQRLAAMAGLMILVFGAILALAPEALVDRLSSHTPEARTSLWRESVGVVGDYPLAGTGLGGFQTAFLKYKALEGQFIVDYAHNDYLQGLAEMGIVGFLIPVALIGLIVRRATRIAGDASAVRWVGVGCLGSVAAILIHSTVDFNLYAPANAAVFAWICGVTAGVRPLPPRIVRRRDDDLASEDRLSGS